MRVLKWVAIAVGVLIVIAGGVGAFLAATFDPNDYKPRIVGLVKRESGRTLAIDGKTAPGGDLLAWLGATSAVIDTVFVVDSSNAITAEVQAAIGTAVSGPLGYATAENTTAPALP